jgi:phage shock protein A
MAEGLFSRVKRLVSGSINGLVDQVEKGKVQIVMAEALREVDRTLDDLRSELGQVMAQRHQAGRHFSRTKEKVKELEEKARFAVEQGREDLAEAALSRQMDLEAQLPVIEATLASAAAQQADIEGYVAALGGRKREMERELAMLAANVQPTAAEALSAGVSAQVGRRVEAAEGAFNRALHGSLGIGNAASTDIETVSKLAELEKVKRAHTLASRLAALRPVQKAG